MLQWKNVKFSPPLLLNSLVIIVCLTLNLCCSKICKHISIKTSVSLYNFGPLRFQIDLGCDADDLALHFNPRFHDDADGSVVVCNSKTDGCWGEEKREIHNPLQRGTDVKVRECYWEKSRSVQFTQITRSIFTHLPSVMFSHEGRFVWRGFKISVSDIFF